MVVPSQKPHHSDILLSLVGYEQNENVDPLLDPVAATETLLQGFQPQDDLMNKEDKLHRIRELWDDFMSRCRANYWPTREIGLDEAIKRFKGRCSFKQYIKNKPVRWGLKLFCVCCSATGYLWNAAWYLGKMDESEAKQAETSATHRAVIQILSPWLTKIISSTWIIFTRPFLF